MTALVCLRCVNTNTKDILMASNADDIGDFDDIVLLKESLEGSCIAYMVQLKHQDTPKDLKPADFISHLTKSKDFKLSKYSQSFRTLKDKLETFSPDESEIIKRLRKVDKIIFVLFTNKGVGDCIFLKKRQDDVLSFLNSSSLNNDLYCFDGAQLQDCNSEFLQSLFLLTKQTNVDGLDVLIKKEIERIINPMKLIDEDLNTVSKDFVTFIKTWVQSKLSDQYFLTKHDIMNKLVSLLLDCFKINLTDNLNEAIQIDIFHDICCAYAITIVNWDEKVFQYLVQYLAGQLENYCGRNELTVNRKKQEKKYWGATFKHWGNNLRPQLKDLLYRKHEDFKEHMFKIGGNPKSLTFSDIYQYLWLTCQLPLLLEVNTFEEFQNIVHILELSQFTFHVVLLNKTGQTLPKPDSNLKRFETLQDLNDNHKGNVLNRKIKLQGRPSTFLRDIVDDSMFQHLSSNDVISILLDNFNIGNVHEAPFDYLIERCIYRVLVNPAVLENINSELFLIEMKPKLAFDLVDLSKIIKIDDISSADLSKQNIIIAEGDDDQKEEQMQNFYESSVKTVHWLLYHGMNQLEWKKTLGSIKNVNKYRLKGRENCNSQLTYTVDELFLLPNTTNILSASPGMGKSTLMNYLAHRAPEDVWILNVNLNQHETYFDSENCQNCETPASDHLEYFSGKILEKQNCDTKLAKVVFQKMVDAKKVVVFLDGFDEVSIFFRDEVTNIAKCIQREGFKVWITTRPIMKSHLEEELDSISTDLKPFSIEEQKEFLEKYFVGANTSRIVTSENLQTMKQFIKELLDTSAVNLNDRDREFMGIPLQIKLLAEAFNADCLKSIKANIIKFNKNFDLLYLYESFVKTKTDILCAKHGLKEKKEYERHKEYQSFTALKVIFKHQLLQKLNIEEKLQRCEEFLGKGFFQKGGIMVAKNEFVHRTYPEYLSAKWLAENLSHKDNKVCRTVEILLNERFNQQYKFLFNIFDRIVCRGCDVHLSVINGQLENTFEIITSSIDNVVSEDKLGRSPLHIVALYGEFSPSQTFYEYLVKLNEDTKNNIAKLVDLVLNYEKITIKNDKLGYSALDYAIANGSLETANKICARSIEVNIKVILPEELKAKYFLYCAKMDYEYLFETLLRYFSYMTIINKTNKLLDEYCVECCEDLLPQMPPEILERLKYYIKKHDGDLTDVYTYTPEPAFTNSRMYFNVHVATAISGWYNVDLLISNGTEINKLDIFSRTPLHYAVLFDKPEMVTLLLQKGAQINTTDKEGNTPLHHAVKERNLNLINILLQKDAKVNIEDKNNRTVLQLAMQSNRKDIQLLFSERGLTEETTTPVPWEDAVCDIVVEDKIIDVLINHAFQQTLELNQNDTVTLNDNKLKYSSKLHEAVIEGDLLAIEKIISRGADINVQNYFGDTVLHWAVRQKNLAVVKLLLSLESDVNVLNSEGDTPLYCSLRENCDDITMLLLHGVEKSKVGDTIVRNRIVEINKQNIYKESPLILAARRGKTKIVELLISRGANVNATDGMKNGALHHAAKYGSQDIILELLAAGGEINAQNENEDTSLHLAISEGHTDVVALLLTRGADVNILGRNGNTVLHDAAEFDFQDIILLLLDYGASVDINKMNDFHKTPLHIAVDKDHLDNAKVLLENRADANISGCREKTALHIAADSDFQTMVLALLDAGAEINRQDVEGNTPLDLAASRGYSEVVKLLLARGADINVRGFQGSTGLHAAAEFGSEDTITSILTAGALINDQNINYETPLHLAVAEGHLDAAKLLLSKGADVNIAESSGNTALHYAAMCDSGEIIVALLGSGADINKQNAYDRTPLHLATSCGHLDTVKLLLARGSDVDTPDNSGNTALHFAADFGSIDIISSLLAAGAAINVQGDFNDTALHLAALKDHLDAVQFLLANGSDISIVNDSGDTALHNATRLGSEDMISTLLTAAIEVNSRNIYNDTPLYFAIFNDLLDVVKFLLAKGADVSVISFEDNTTLHYAAIYGSRQIISVFLRTGVGIDSQNANGETPLHLAVSKRHLDKVKLLLANGADVHLSDNSGNTALHNAAEFDFTHTTLDDCSEADEQDMDNSTNLEVPCQDEIDRTLNVVEDNTKQFVSQDIILELLKAGAEINKKNDNYKTPLHLAASKGLMNSVKLLAAKGADVNTPDSNGNAALHIAASCGSHDMVSVLIDAGSEVNGRDAASDTPLHLAASKDHFDTVKLLLANGADVGIAGSNENTALHIAVLFGSKNVVATILEAGASSNAQNAKGDTPLHLVALNDRTNVVKSFLAKGADVNILGEDRNTALHNAAQFGSRYMIATLLDSGSEINKQNAKNKTPLHIAVSRGDLNIVGRFLTRGADINIIDCNKDTVLHYALMLGSFDITLKLLNAGARAIINNRNAESQTPLHLAVGKNQLDGVKTLLAYGADLNIPDGNGKTALQLARELDLQDIISELLNAAKRVR